MFCGELESTARHRRKRPDFADNRCDAGSAQPLFHCPQDLGIAPCLNQHDPTGVEPVGGKTKPIEIRVRQTPEHHASRRVGEPSDDIGGKNGGECAILFVAICSKDFVQRAAGEPATRQSPVHRRDAERQNPMDRRCRPLDPPDPFAELGEGVFHARPGAPGRSIDWDGFAQNLWVLLVKVPLLRRIPWLRHSRPPSPCECSLYVLRARPTDVKCR